MRQRRARPRRVDLAYGCRWPFSSSSLPWSCRCWWSAPWSGSAPRACPPAQRSTHRRRSRSAPGSTTTPAVGRRRSSRCGWSCPRCPYGCEPEAGQAAGLHLGGRCATPWCTRTTTALVTTGPPRSGSACLPKDLVAGTLSDTTTQLFDTLRVAFFTDQKTTVKNARLGSRWSWRSPSRRHLRPASTYSIDGLSSRYDRLCSSWSSSRTTSTPPSSRSRPERHP